MDGFKNSSKTHYMKGGSCDGYAKGGKVKGAAKIAKVMGEFKSGTLHSGSKKGPEVTNPKQAVAIALSEARKAGAKVPVKKYGGGRMSESTSSRPVDSKGRPISNEQLGVSARGAGMGSMTEAEKRAMAATLARAERMQAEEAGESRMVRRPRDPRVPMIKRSHGGLAAMPKKK